MTASAIIEYYHQFAFVSSRWSVLSTVSIPGRSLSGRKVNRSQRRKAMSIDRAEIITWILLMSAVLTVFVLVNPGRATRYHAVTL
jgi:hypothetical protein